MLLSGNLPEVYAGGQEGQGRSPPVHLSDPSLGAEPLPPPELCLAGSADIRADMQREGRGLPVCHAGILHRGYIPGPALSNAELRRGVGSGWEMPPTPCGASAGTHEQPSPPKSVTCVQGWTPRGPGEKVCVVRKHLQPARSPGAQRGGGPGEDRPQVLWAGVQAGRELTRGVCVCAHPCVCPPAFPSPAGKRRAREHQPAPPPCRPRSETALCFLPSTFGELKTVRLPKKMTGTGAHRGFGFVDFLTKQDAKVRAPPTSSPFWPLAGAAEFCAFSLFGSNQPR